MIQRLYIYIHLCLYDPAKLLVDVFTSESGQGAQKRTVQALGAGLC